MAAQNIALQHQVDDLQQQMQSADAQLREQLHAALQGKQRAMAAVRSVTEAADAHVRLLPHPRNNREVIAASKRQ